MGKDAPWWESYKVDMPEGRSGDWEIKRFEVSQADEDFGKMRAAISSSSCGRYVSAGTYTGLTRRGKMIMSDTPSEIRDHLRPVTRARNNVLINGLGLGMVTRMCLQKPQVISVWVVEKSRDVIMLVEPWLEKIAKEANTRLVIIQADALTWQPTPGTRWEVVWHDIFDDICADNLPVMHRLHRRFGRRCDWQGSWGRELCERLR